MLSSNMVLKDKEKITVSYGVSSFTLEKKNCASKKNF